MIEETIKENENERQSKASDLPGELKENCVI